MPRIKHPLIVVDVEADGPAPGHHDLYSMVSFAAVVVEPSLSRTFVGKVRPISKKWIAEALAVGRQRMPDGTLAQITRKDHEGFPPPAIVIPRFREWVMSVMPDPDAGETPRATMISDNIGFDWSFINYYFWYYCNSNPFGHSGRRLNDLYAGSQNDAGATTGWKDFRKTKHTHDPLDDAQSMAEALLEMKARGMRFKMIPDDPALAYGVAPRSALLSETS